MVGPTIMRAGTEEQKEEWLPKMLDGNVECALGYTEPDAGTDLAGLGTRAVEDGDDFVINGAISSFYQARKKTYYDPIYQFCR